MSSYRNEVVSREQLLRDVWGYHELAITRTVDNYIAKLRNHLEPGPTTPLHRHRARQRYQLLI
ncbi:MAG: helix-turn-helix domain-containing protein [Vicinamibacterales bacterium]